MMFKNSYNTVIGASKSGKSYLIKKQCKGACLYFNYIGERKDWSGWVEVDRKVSKKQVLNLLNKNFKVVFHCSRNEELRVKEILNLWNLTKSISKKNLTIIMDECHLWNEKELKKVLIEMATSGRHYCNSLVFATQRLALIDNAIPTQSENIFIFRLRFEEGYFKDKGIDMKRLQKELKEKKYHFIKIDEQGNETKPMIVK